MATSIRYTLLSGLGFILVANGLALGDVWYNRSGIPDAKLTLTERELNIPYSFWHERENSGLALRLKWDVDNTKSRDDRGRLVWFGGEADWLDDRKLDALGIHVQPRTPGSNNPWSFCRLPVN